MNPVSAAGQDISAPIPALIPDMQSAAVLCPEAAEFTPMSAAYNMKTCSDGNWLYKSVKSHSLDKIPKIKNSLDLSLPGFDNYHCGGHPSLTPSPVPTPSPDISVSCSSHSSEDNDDSDVPKSSTTPVPNP